MDGERYYSFSPPEDLLTTDRDARGVLRPRLDQSRSDAAALARRASGRVEGRMEGVLLSPSALHLRSLSQCRRACFAVLLEPLLVRHGVDAVFSGHEHIYQRSELQSGIQYFISGGAGSLRPGDGTPASYVARTYDARLSLHVDRDRWRRAALSSDLSRRPDDRCRHVCIRTRVMRRGRRPALRVRTRRSFADRAEPRP